MSAATLTVGDRVMFDGPDGWEEAEVVSGVREDGRVAIRFAGGGELWAPLLSLDSTRVSVERGRGRQQRNADPELLRLTVEAIAGSLDFERRLVLDELVAAGDAGMMDREHHDRHGRAPEVVRRIREDLVRQGLVEDTGLKRQTVRKQRARAWRVTARGRAVHELLHATYGRVGSR